MLQLLHNKVGMGATNRSVQVCVDTVLSVYMYIWVSTQPQLLDTPSLSLALREVDMQGWC